MTAARALRRLARWAVLAALVALVVPAASVRPATITLTTVERASAVDFGEEDVVWVLVLGSDAKGSTPVDKGNTDAIQLLGFDMDTGSAAGIGIPRDSWVELPDGFARINEALAQGGPELAAEAVADLVGITPQLVLVTAMDGFIDITDAVGGVDVESDKAFVTDSGDLRVTRGTNHFDGAEALDYARTRRNLDGGDFERAAHHQALLLGYLRGLRDRADEEGFMERTALAALGGLESDLAPTDLYRLAQAVTQVDPERVTGCIIGGTDGTTEGEPRSSTPTPRRRARWAKDAEDDARLQGGCRGGEA